jgi:hypothetical protein
MNRKFIAAILLIAAVSMYAHAQNPKVSKGDAQKVMTIISGDKIKTQAYCDIQKLAEQVAEANEKKDVERVNELFEKIETLEKTIGLEYVALIDGVQDIAKNEQLRAEFFVGIWSTRQALYEVKHSKIRTHQQRADALRRLAALVDGIVNPRENIVAIRKQKTSP